MPTIGLTGSIGSGKSTVASMLAARGALVVDADDVARRLVEPGKPAFAEVTACFGPAFIREDGTLDRRKLGKRVFEDEKARRQLERIIHPLVKKELKRRCRRLTKEHPEKIIVLDVPLLLETGMDRMVDFVVVVKAPAKTSLARLQEHRGLSREEALLRLRSQMPIEEKLRRADWVIDNGGSLEETAAAVDRLWGKIMEKFSRDL